MASEEQLHLLRVLDERDIPLGPEDVRSAFEDAQTRVQAQSWIREYLTPSTLLTRDEREFYEKRDSPSTIERRHQNQAVSLRSSDTDVEVAIKSLEASTAAIEEQCKLLESQKLALQQLTGRNAQANTPASGLDNQQRSLERQRAQVDFSIDELSQSLVERLKLASKQADSLAGNIPSNADRLFDKDDRLLDGLQKLLPTLSRPPTQAADDVDIEKLCSTLTVLSAQEIRARLNAAYVDSFAKFGSQMNGSADIELSEQQQKQRDTLRAELAELSGEIDGLVGIVVDHRHRNPIKVTQNSAQADSLGQRVSWGEYLVATMQYLTARLDKLNDHVQHIHAHQAALRSLSASLDDANAMQPAAGSSQDVPTRKASSKGLKPLRLVQANLSELQDPTIQLLRQLDVRTSEINDLTKPEGYLDSALHERVQKLAGLSKTTEAGITDAAARSLSSTDRELHHLVSAVHAYSRARSVSLVDETVATALQRLEQDTQRISEEMRELDVDHIARSVKAKQAEKLKSIRH